MTTKLEFSHLENDEFREEWENLRNELVQSPRKKKQTPSRRVSIDWAADTNRDRLIKEIKDLEKDEVVVNWHEFNTAKDSKTKSDYWKKIIGSKVDLKLLDNPRLKKIKDYLLDYKKCTKLVFDHGTTYYELKDEFDKIIDENITGNLRYSPETSGLLTLDFELEEISRNGNKLTKAYHELDKLN